jgi:hypothetical protein
MPLHPPQAPPPTTARPPVPPPHRTPGPPVQFLPSVTELVVAQCYYLDFDDRNRNKPIYVYLNSTGCINDKGQVRAPRRRHRAWGGRGQAGGQAPGGLAVGGPDRGRPSL